MSSLGTTVINCLDSTAYAVGYQHITYMVGEYLDTQAWQRKSCGLFYQLILYCPMPMLMVVVTLSLLQGFTAAWSAVCMMLSSRDSP